MTLRYLREPGTIIGTAAEFTSRNLVLLNRQVGTETDTGKSKLGNGATVWNSLAYLPGSGASVTGLVPIANPAGGVVETAESPFFGEGDIQVVVMTAPGEGESAPTVLAFQVEGNDFPTFILNSDIANTGLCLGDGATDPSDQVQITVTGGGGITIWSAGQVKLRSNDIQFVGVPGGDNTMSNFMLMESDQKYDATKGPVLTDTADGHTYRLVSTNGALVLQQVS